MGILNVTPDSFSDGGCYADTQAAVRGGIALLEAGADVIDIGGESTRPGAQPVTVEEEKRRVLPVIEQLAKRGAILSADTMKPALMRAALSCGASIINDVSGFSAPHAVAAVVDSDCGLVVMHKQGRPATMQEAPQYEEVVAEVDAFLRARTDSLIAAGVSADRLCVDVGIGFGKTLAHNQQLLRALPVFTRCYPLLVGVSRKSLFSAVTTASPAQRDFVSAVAAALLVARGAEIVRVHNVAMTKQALSVRRLVGEVAL